MTIERQDILPLDETTKIVGDILVHQVSYDDPFKDENFNAITAMLSDRMAEGFHGDASVDLKRKRKSTVDLENPSTKWFYDNLPGFADWHGLIPTAAALEPIYNPDIDAFSNGKPLTPEIRVWLRNIYDALGMRSRAAVMQEIIVDEVMRSDHRQSWVSLACGAARPVFSALSEIRNEGGFVPNVSLIDFDKDALKLAKESASDEGFAGAISTRRMNILKPDGVAYKRDGTRGLFSNALAYATKLRAESFDMVDAVGILEYLKPDDWTRKKKASDENKYEYQKVLEQATDTAGAVTFLRNAYELVKPGGVLVVGNMRDTHPQLGFTLNVIQWPHIQPRSIEEMDQIFSNAGLDGTIEAYCPDDNVYAIYVIRKSL